ncbi:HAMP domain-containing histidine kinase [Alteromonas portus]|uniref:histidine kinase n=1 Tax=Alteromonas portus TaxID=2565549 RepID=A0A4U0ZC66_9ALTE|nr:HAMP domain-containing sensor histidine kinase [Alteromonas portus]TKB03419.1 HAMP domain-containing histidine kinase [Alteromonas portus]
MVSNIKWSGIKENLGFKRLFWRIFVAFWVASLVVMAATGYVLVNEYTANNYNNRFLDDATNQAERIVWRYEHEALTNGRSKSEIKEWVKRRNGRENQLIPMLISTPDNDVVYHYRMNKVPEEHRITREIYGPSNIRYIAQFRQPQTPRIYKQVLSRFQSVQFIFIFLASAMVSALLSWSIVKPIKYLGAFSRKYANDQTATPVPSQLLTRGDELSDLAADINFMVSKTADAIGAQQRLLHDVSHELRAPLARLQASAAIIEQHQPENKHVLQIHNDCHRMDQLIQQILNFSTLENTPQNTEQCDVIALCERVLDDMAINYPGIPTTLTFDQTHRDNATINGFPEALHQALDNIVGNACKYSNKGQPVTVEVTSSANSVVIVVKDNGIGVDNAEIEKLMQPFYRAGNQMHTEGFGLGLTIALKAVEKHDGTLTMQSPENGGLRVEITLPKDSTTQL